MRRLVGGYAWFFLIVLAICGCNRHTTQTYAFHQEVHGKENKYEGVVPGEWGHFRVYENYIAAVFQNTFLTIDIHSGTARVTPVLLEGSKAHLVYALPISDSTILIAAIFEDLRTGVRAAFIGDVDNYGKIRRLVRTDSYLPQQLCAVPGQSVIWSIGDRIGSDHIANSYRYFRQWSLFRGLIHAASTDGHASRVELSGQSLQCSAAGATEVDLSNRRINMWTLGSRQPILHENFPSLPFDDGAAVSGNRLFATVAQNVESVEAGSPSHRLFVLCHNDPTAQWQPVDLSNDSDRLVGRVKGLNLIGSSDRFLVWQTYEPRSEKITIVTEPTPDVRCADGS